LFITIFIHSINHILATPQEDRPQMMGGVKRRKPPLNAKEAPRNEEITDGIPFDFAHGKLVTSVRLPSFAALIFCLLFHQGKSKRKE